MRRRDGFVVAVFAVADLRIEQHVSVAGSPRDTLYFDGKPRRWRRPGRTRAFPRRLSAVAALSPGSSSRVARPSRIRDITVRYTGERHQFGKPMPAASPACSSTVVGIAQQAAMLEMAADLVAPPRPPTPAW